MNSMDVSTAVLPLDFVRLDVTLFCSTGNSVKSAVATSQEILVVDEMDDDGRNVVVADNKEQESVSTDVDERDS